MLAAAYEFAGKKQERTLAAIDENELIDASASGVVLCGEAVAMADYSRVALFTDENFPGSEALFECEEVTSVRGVAGDDGEDADVFIGDGSK